MHKYLHFTCILLSISFRNAQRGDIDDILPLINPCASFETCTSCLQEPNCAWCSEQVCRFLDFKMIYIFMLSEYFNLTNVEFTQSSDIFMHAICKCKFFYYGGIKSTLNAT